MTSLSFTVNLHRKNGKRIDASTIEDNLIPVIEKSLKGLSDFWIVKTNPEVSGPTSKGNLYLYKTSIVFDRTKPADENRLTVEMNSICAKLEAVGSTGPFSTYPWTVHSKTATGWKPVANPVSLAGEKTEKNKDGDLSYVVDFEEVRKLEDIEVPDMLIHGTDEQIESHSAFEGIYGRAAHVRVMFSSINTMKETKGMRRNHCILHGLPGCAKSSLFKGVQTVLGKGAYLSLNANSATRAGIEAIFLRRLKETGTPPFLFVEEIEKTPEAVLTVWLSILDERAEVRKITHHEASKAEARILGFASANDKVLFDRLMGGRPGRPGALSSRFNKSLYVPRPNRETMRRILLRDVKLYGGHADWVEKCLEISDQVNTNDPRIVLGFLDGGDRLMDGSYLKDIMSIHDFEVQDKKDEKVFLEEGEPT